MRSGYRDTVEFQTSARELPDWWVHSAAYVRRRSSSRMAALLDDPTRIHHEDAVHRLDRGQPVRDHQRGPSRHRLSERLLDVDLTLAVKALVASSSTRSAHPEDGRAMAMRCAGHRATRVPDQGVDPSGSGSMKSNTP